MSHDAPRFRVAHGMDVIVDRRRILLGGGLILGFTFSNVKAFARASERRVNDAGPQSLSNDDVAVVAGEGFSGFAPDAFIRIAADNQITLILPNAEMGQGVYTGEAMLIAEELEVGLDQVRVVAAPPNEALYKQPLLQFQGTGGSTSIRGAWEPLRKAGATAREMLIGAASDRWKVPPRECLARRGEVLHQSSGRRLPYGQLVDAASSGAVPKDVPLKTPDRFSLIGKGVQRVDTPGKANGTAVFGIDVMVPGMKFATVTACPVPGGTLDTADDSAARAIPGVLQVVRLPNAVAVVGDHFWVAKQGLDALRISWKHGANGKLSSAALWKSLTDASRNGRGAVAHQAGNVERAMRDADKRVEAVYRQPFLAHAAMEPAAAVAHVQGGKAEVWCGTQVPSRAQADTAKLLGLPVEAVTIHNMLIGGAFGRKLETDYVVQAAAVAQQCAFPVKLVWSREEDIRRDNFRPMYVDRLSAGLDEKGLPVAWRHRVTAASVTARFAPAGMRPNGVDPDAVEEAEDPVYGSFPNMLVDYVQHPAPPGLTVSWWRGVGPLHAVFVVESFVDELAHAADRDPVEYRRALLQKVPRARAVLDRAAQASGWGTPLPAGAGRGVIVQKCFGSFLALVVEVGVSDEGDVTLRRITAAIDCGLTVNPNLVRQQMEGGILFGLTAALFQEITFADGQVQQSNFHDYRMLRIDETPPIVIEHVQTANPPGGVGETGTTAAAPALCNAIFAATGVRLRQVPVDRALLQKNARGKSRDRANDGDEAMLIPLGIAAAAIHASVADDGEAST